MTEIRAVAHPLRLKILRLLGKKPMTTKQVAVALGEKPTKLYHHMQGLEKVGLVRLVEDRQSRGFIEHYFEAIAGDFLVDSNLLSHSEGLNQVQDGSAQLLIAALQDTVDEAQNTFDQGRLSVVGAETRAAVIRFQTDSSEVERNQRMGEFTELLKRLNTHETYTVTLSFFPTSRNA